jgi:hypothetical protein
MAAGTAVAVMGAAATVGSSSSPGRATTLRSPPPVRIAALPAGQTDLLADGRYSTDLVLRRGKPIRVRVQVVLRRTGQPDTPLGPARSARLTRGRRARVPMPLAQASRAAVAACAPARIVVNVSARGSTKPRTAATRLRLDPPACGRFFAPAAFWNTPLPADAPLDPDSGPVTEELLSQVRAGFDSGPKPTINTTSYAPPVVTVSRSQPRVRVRLDRPPGYAPDLEAAWASVPLPDDAQPANGNDSELVLYQPSTDTLWEFWQLRRTRDGWQAAWGGRIERVSSSPGHYSRPNAHWGTTASSLSLAGGLITPDELARGQIDHALAIGIPRARAGEYALPAQRTDGRSTCAHAVPEGARFRLDPALNIDSLGLSPPAAALARAVQRYGIVVRDQSGSIAFYAQNPITLGADPYPRLFGGLAPWDLLATFPWQHLQLTRMELVKTGDGGGLPPAPDVLGGCG